MAETIEPVNNYSDDSSSDSEAEVLFSLNDRIIKDAKDGKQYVKWKTPLHPPSEEDNVPTFQHPNAPILVEGDAVFRRPLPIVAPNYTYWADLIFEPGSRDKGVVLVVEGTSRWCWFHPFENKKASTIGKIMEGFMDAVAGRITSLVTDAGNEWA